ncbi:MAG: lytic murein transglycosylase [Rhizobiales bacterium]|nr:lytic murein transglycosylase [Hyphomicrobiales bacterium]
MRKTFIAALLAVAAIAAPAQADAKFEAFIENTVWPLVKKQGVARGLFDKAFAGIAEPDASVLKLAGNQPEFTSTTSAYLEKAVTPIRIETGQQMKAREAALLSAIEKKYGVDRHILLGIWGMESNFGKDKGSMKVMQSLATLLYAGRKRDYAREQIVAAFKILKSGVRTPENFTGSWAAAMGHTQFIPTSYISRAVDWTGDGVRDIWGSKEDALASTANYLNKSGWIPGLSWGWEIDLPKGFERALIGRTNRKPILAWIGMGIVRADGGKLPKSDARAFVMVPQGVNGPAFLVTKNFEAIMTYNISHSYALAVGHLADRIRGGGAIVGNWPDTSFDLSYEQRLELQRRLNNLGFDTGLVDGRFGARTYEAIIAYQKRVGLPLDGVPSVKLLQRVKKGS